LEGRSQGVGRTEEADRKERPKSEDFEKSANRQLLGLKGFTGCSPSRDWPLACDGTNYMRWPRPARVTPFGHLLSIFHFSCPFPVEHVGSFGWWNRITFNIIYIVIQRNKF
jgi:hypothetical protein